MSSQRAPSTTILYQNAAKTVTLFDIPTSIALAQDLIYRHNGSLDPMAIPLSTPPPEKPFPSAEPKSSKRHLLPQAQDYTFPLDLFMEALETIDVAVANAAWCSQRQIWSSEADKQMTVLNSILEERLQRSTEWSVAEPVRLMSTDTELDARQIKDRMVCNDQPLEVGLKLLGITTEYRIPPFARFLLSNITTQTAMSFSMAALQIHPEPSTMTNASAGQFDVIVLDPPWPNRSVRRSHKYQTMDMDENPMKALSGVFGQHIAPRGLVACWITNKAAVRNFALAVLNSWGLEIIEEWAWLKVTTRGKPVTAIDGVWRKPYEMLLVGRKGDAIASVSEDRLGGQEKVIRRVIVAVPDIHSRKPNLRELIAQMLPGQISDYRCLEIFARNLTSGWCAWGNEVLKYNDVHAWSFPADHVQSPSLDLQSQMKSEPE